jgi:serine/threonine protein kinase
MIGKTLAHYEVLSKLGEGVMGAVCLAWDTKLGREVALKILPDLLSSIANNGVRHSKPVYPQIGIFSNHYRNHKQLP